MSEAVKLLDCPCCGSKAQVCQWRDTLNPNATWIECTNDDCGLMTKTYYDDDQQEAKRNAVAAWNKRQCIIDFVNEVCAMAEQKMLITHKLEGAHYASMMEVAKRYGYEQHRAVRLIGVKLPDGLRSVE